MPKPKVNCEPRTEQTPADQASTRWIILTFALLVLSVAFKLLVVTRGGLSLSFDEAYYWHWSKNLDWCYFSKGPGIALLIRATTELLGDTELGVRAGAIFCSTLTLVVAYLLSRRVFGCEKTAFLTILLFAVTPLFTGLGVLTTIDSPLTCAWTVATACLWMALRSTSMGWWIGLGLAMAVGTQFKFTMLLFLASLFATIVMMPDRKKHLLSAGPYVASLLGLSSLLPILAWNISRGWITLGHTIDKASTEGRGLEISAKYVLPSLGQQIGILSPILGVGLLWGTILLTRDAFRRSTGGEARMTQAQAGFLLGVAAPIGLFYSLLSFHRMVEANWMIVVYVTLVPAAAFYWLRPFARWQQWSLAGALAVAVLVHVPFIAGDLFYLSKGPERLLAAGIPFKPTYDLTNRLYGRHVLGEEVGRRMREMEVASGDSIYFLSDHYSFAAWVGFYAKAPDRVFVIPSDRIHNQFHLWGREGRTLPRGATVVVAYDREKGGRDVAPLFDRLSDDFESRVVTREGFPIREYLFRTCFGYLGDESAPAIMRRVDAAWMSDPRANSPSAR